VQEDFHVFSIQKVFIEIAKRLRMVMEEDAWKIDPGLRPMLPTIFRQIREVMEKPSK
jgi:hypothetical protein